MKEEKDLISVIIPVYNAEKYLGRCIECVLAQTYKNIEIYLINDGSTDNSLEVCNKFSEKDKRIKVVDKKNSGVSGTRNSGIEKANGRYLCFIDSDDYIEKDHIEKLVSNIQDGSITFCGYYIDTYNENGIIASKNKSFKGGKSDTVKENLADIFHQGFLSVIWNKIYDVDLLKKNNVKFDEGISLGEDLLFNLKYLRTGIEKIKYIDMPLYHYTRTDNESLDNKYRSDFLEIQERIFSELLSVMDEYQIYGSKKGLINFDFFGAVVVAADNYYQFVYQSKKNKHELKQVISDACDTIRRNKIIGNTCGCGKVICYIRFLMLRVGLYRIDFGFRNFLKRILGL